MDLPTFTASLPDTTPPSGLSLALQALWWDAKGDWEQAHECAQAREDADGNRVHAYLHRKEGDISNAGYWYRRAGVTPASGTLEAEWEAIVRGFLREG
jgi:hypothetical protein